jgi:gamma-glutamyltranspeptidase / glutathione hydrolase
MKGVVAAGHPVTAEAGAEMLREGGNAFDAAVAAVLASFASESLLTGLGAGGFMLAHTAAGEDHLLDFFVEAGGRGLDPAARSELVSVEILFDEVPQVFNIGPSSCGVPGTAAGLWEVGERLCSMPFDALAAPAIRHAREGVRVTTEQAYVFDILAPIITRFPETCELYAPDGALLTAGDLFRFTELGDALERLASDGPRWIYHGEGAKRVCEWVCERGGLLSTEDFGAYEVIERAPIRAAYRGREVLTNAPPSSGGILIAYALDLLERAGGPRELDDPDGLALVAEAMEEANRARAGDFNRKLHEPGFGERFLSGAHVEEALARIMRRLGAGQPDVRAGGGDAVGSTTHVSVLDEDGNAASVTCSDGSSSGVLVPGTGIHLNNMLGEEDLNPLGFHMHEPGTRVTSMMAPTVVLRDGQIEISLGSAGSNRLRSAILQVIRNIVDHGYSVQEAVTAGRLHHEAGILHAEPGFSATALDELERRGYQVVRWRGLNLFFGGAQAARRDPATGELSGAGDPRRGGAAVVVE